MPLVNDVYVPIAAVGTGHAATPQPPAETIRKLHVELAAIGLPVAATETGAAEGFGLG